MAGQLMVISRSSRPANLPNVKLENKTLAYQSTMNKLGILFDSRLTFTKHVKDLAGRAARKFACLRRIARFLDGEGCTAIYNFQIRFSVEYSPLVWPSCPPSYLRLLDKIQERAQTLVNNKLLNTQPEKQF